MFQDKPMKFQPGEKFEYNDGGFILLGLIVEESGRDSDGVLCCEVGSGGGYDFVGTCEREGFDYGFE